MNGMNFTVCLYRTFRQNVNMITLLIICFVIKFIQVLLEFQLEDSQHQF